MKYAKRKNSSIDADYQYYLGSINLYGLLFGHKLGRKASSKANYIWKSLLKQYGRL